MPFFALTAPPCGPVVGIETDGDGDALGRLMTRTVALAPSNISA
jgi:hypothetical protein